MLLSWKLPQKHKGGTMFADDPRPQNRKENDVPHAMDAFVKAGIERRTSEVSNNCRLHLKLLTAGET